MLVIACLAQFMVVLDATVVNIALPSVQRGLHFSAANLQWVVNGYTLIFGGFLLLGGRAADLLGRKRLFVAGVVLFSAASLLNGFAQSSGMLIVGRGLQGLGGALVSPAALSIVTTTFTDGARAHQGPRRVERDRRRRRRRRPAARRRPHRRRLLARGCSSSTSRSGSPPSLLALRYVAESRADVEHRSFDLPGAFTVTSGLVVLVYAIVKAQAYGWGSARTLGLGAVAVALLAAFVAIEHRSSAPLMRLTIFRVRTLAVADGALLLVASGMFGMFFFASLYVQEILGYSPLRAGLAFLPVTAGIMIGAGIAQQLIRRVGVRNVAVSGISLAAAGMLILTHLPVHGSYAGNLLVGLMPMSIGMGLTFVPITLLGTGGVSGEDAGLASGLFNTAQQVGGSLGLAILSTLAASQTSSLLHAARRRRAALAARVSGYHVAFLAAAIMLGIGALLMAFVAAPAAPADVELELAHGGRASRRGGRLDQRTAHPPAEVENPHDGGRASPAAGRRRAQPPAPARRRDRRSSGAGPRRRGRRDRPERRGRARNAVSQLPLQGAPDLGDRGGADARVARRARALLDAPDPGEALFDLIDQSVGRSQTDRALFDALADTWLANDEIRAAHAELIGVLDALLVRAQEAGAVRPDVSAVDVLMMLKGVCEAIGSFQHVDPGRGRSASSIWSAPRSEPPGAGRPLRGRRPSSRTSSAPPVAAAGPEPVAEPRSSAQSRAATSEPASIRSARPSANSEHRRRRDHAGADPRAEVALDAVAHRVAAAVGVKALEVEPELLGPAPQVRVLEPRLVGEQRVVHLPEAALAPRPPRRRTAAAQARGWLERTGKWRNTTRSSAPGQPRAAGRAQNGHSKSAYSITQRRRRPGPRSGRPPRAAGPERSRARSPAERRSAQAAERVEDQVGAGQIARGGRLIAPLHDAVGADDGQRPLREAALVVDAEGAAGGALGLEVRQLLDAHAELLLKRGLRVGGVAGDAVQGRSRAREARPAPPRRG